MGSRSRVVMLVFATACNRHSAATPDAPSLSQPTDAFAPSDTSIDAAVGSATITPGAPDRFLLTGEVLAPSGPFAGQVLVEQSTITCVDVSCAAMPGASGATLI